MAKLFFLQWFLYFMRPKYYAQSITFRLLTKLRYNYRDQSVNSVFGLMHSNLTLFWLLGLMINKGLEANFKLVKWQYVFFRSGWCVKIVLWLLRQDYLHRRSFALFSWAIFIRGPNFLARFFPDWCIQIWLCYSC